MILILVAAFLQSALAVAAMLIDAGVIKPGGYGYPPGTDSRDILCPRRPDRRPRWRMVRPPIPSVVSPRRQDVSIALSAAVGTTLRFGVSHRGDCFQGRDSVWGDEDRSTAER